MAVGINYSQKIPDANFIKKANKYNFLHDVKDAVLTDKVSYIIDAHCTGLS